MKKIEKLLRKIGKKDKTKLLKIIERLIQGKKQGLNIRKVTNSDFYRLRSGPFRIIFHYFKKEIIIDSIKLKKEDTYKNL